MTDNMLSDWLERLQSQHPVEIDLGLERVSAVARALNLVPAPIPTLTVAGTTHSTSALGPSFHDRLSVAATAQARHQ